MVLLMNSVKMFGFFFFLIEIYIVLLMHFNTKLIPIFLFKKSITTHLQKICESRGGKWSSFFLEDNA
jgi:hypothetical protein